MEIIGQLKLKYDTQKVSEKFQKREFVLATDLSTPYPQYILFQLTQDKCNVIDHLNIGEDVKVQFNLRGREWNGPQGIRYFNTIEAWRVERLNGSNSGGGSSHQQNDNHNQAPVFNNSISDNDDLPF